MDPMGKALTSQNEEFQDLAAIPPDANQLDFA